MQLPARIRPSTNHSPNRGVQNEVCRGRRTLTIPSTLCAAASGGHSCGIPAFLRPYQHDPHIHHRAWISARSLCGGSAACAEHDFIPSDPTSTTRTSTTAARGGIRARALCGAAPYAQSSTASTAALSRTSACRWSAMQQRSCAAVSGRPRRPSHSTNARRLSSCSTAPRFEEYERGATCEAAHIPSVLSGVCAGTTPRQGYARCTRMQ